MTQTIQPFIYTTYIRTTPEKLWEALTSGDFTEKYWFGYRIEGDWKVGGALQMRAPKQLNPNLEKKSACMEDAFKVLIYEPPRRLSYTFPFKKESDPDRQPSRVTFDLTPMGEMVKLKLVHEDLLPQDIGNDSTQWSGVNNGWPGVISSLKSLLETGKEIQYTGKAG